MSSEDIENFINLSHTQIHSKKYNVNIYDYCKLSSDAQFDRIYLVSGLRRSGNHLLLQSIFCSCADQSVLFINDFPSLLGIQFTDEMIELQYRVFLTHGLLRKACIMIPYSDSGKFNCGDGNANKLIPKTQINNLEEYTKTWTTREKILIISFEDQPISNMTRIKELFSKRANKIYEIIIIRDILNCFASRIKACCDRKKTHIAFDESSEEYKISESIHKKGGLFVTNTDTLTLWNNHLTHVNTGEYIVFNYNKIICSEEEKIALCRNLEIEYNPLHFAETSTFGSGSSYGNSKTIYVDSLLTRFSNIEFCEKYQEDLLISILGNEEIIRVLKDTFLLELTQDEQNFILKICGKPAEKRVNKLTKYVEPESHIGGYYAKYIKYKNKYLQLKNNKNHKRIISFA